MKKPIPFSVSGLRSPELQNEFMKEMRKLDHPPVLGEVIETLYKLEPEFNSPREDLKERFDKLYRKDFKPLGDGECHFDPCS